MRHFIALIATLPALLSLNGCGLIGLPNVAVQGKGTPANPPILSAFEGAPPIFSVIDWETKRAPQLREAFQNNIYGRFPDAQPVSVIARTDLSLDYANLASAQQWLVQIGEARSDLKFSMVLLLPKTTGPAATKPAPIIVMENFCGNALALKNAAGVASPRFGTPKECQNSLMLPVVPVIFGGAIVHPPIDRILAAGYGVAMLYGGDVVSDDAAKAAKILQQLTPAGTPPSQRTGAIAAWAWTYLRAVDALSSDPRVDAGKLVLWGHSRNGKAALLAAAFDPRPAGVIALQSGTAGGSLGRDDVGESIAKITQAFPHWFAPAYADWSQRQNQMSVDQHQLLALIAPRPVMLGSARRDQWSDPQGALRAAAGASPVYQLYSAAPFVQNDLRQPDFRPGLVTYMRGGLHGIHNEDWDMALLFLERKFSNH